jgi:hypothetical protein
MDGVVVGCADCGDYRIAGAAFHEFMRLEAQSRVAALQAAKGTARGGWPLIATSSAAPR